MCLMGYCRLAFVVLFLLLGLTIFGQDVEQKYKTLRDRIENDPLKMTGSFNAMGQHYSALGIDGRALPFTGRLLAAINFDFLGIKMPFSLAFSNGGVVFNRRLPSYSFVGISPSYKWAKLLIGTRSMDFGKYSFSNHSFTGGGLELTPGDFHISGFYGRLRRARVEDFQGVNNVDPFYRRMGFGAKLGYEKGRDKVLFSLFKAWDDASSIPTPDSSFNFFPSENVILSGEVSKAIGPKMDFEVVYSNSGFTDDRAIPTRTEGFRLSNYGGLLRSNPSTRFNNAFEAKLTYRFKVLSVNVAYERIDPGYRTMGALFFNNDLENISGGAGLKLFKSRVVLNGRIGLQRNNLQGDQANRYNRLVGNINANFRASKNLSFIASYSNFNNVNRRLSVARLDSLVVITDLVLSNRNANAGFNWILTNDNSRSTGIQGALNFSQGSTIENDLVMDDQSTNTTNGNLTYYLQLKPSKWNFGINTAYQRNLIGENTTTFTSAGISIGKVLLQDKMNLSLNVNYSLSDQLADGIPQASGNIISTQFSAGYQVSKTSAIVLNSGFINNDVENINTGTRKFSEFRNMINYTYRFNPKK